MPRQCASNAVLQNQIQYELTFALQKQLAALELDARACYDWIISTCAILISMLHGIPASACHLQKKMLDQALFRISIFLGLSEESFSNTASSLVYGNGQGSGASPPVWVMISSVMLDEMDNRNFEIEFTDPTQSINHDGVMVVYVDDSCAMVNNFSPGEGFDALKSVAQKWEKILYSTGGALDPGNCFFYIVEWGWNSQGHAVMRKKHALDDTLFLYVGNDFVPQEVP